MATLRVDTVSGIGTEGTVLKGGLRFRSKNYLTLPKGDTTQRGRGRGVIFAGDPSVRRVLNHLLSYQYLDVLEAEPHS